MENIQWIFSGIGTEIITLLVGAAIGGIAGYKIGTKKSYAQSQKAKDGSKQKQELLENGFDAITSDKINISKVEQNQKAGKNSEQSQVGRFRNGK